ncbi:MAG: glutamate-cysteine ligase family protein [Bacillota bacterium]
MTKNNYIAQVTEYLARNATKRQDYKLGIELEHFLVREDDFSAVPYYGRDGIAGILAELAQEDWQICNSGEYIICLRRGQDEINLEPGGQIEFSFGPRYTVGEIEKRYEEFYNELEPKLKARGYKLVSLGYQPKTSINEMELLPKERYRYMHDYFKQRGKLAHNMMMGTSSTQVSLDYSDEVDFGKKMAVTSWLSPIIYSTLDNTPFFEGEKAEEYALRAKIWANCDSDRCGILPGSVEGDYTYEDYARYVLNLPAIVDPTSEANTPIKATFAEIYEKERLTKGAIQHMLSFSFTDVRLKEYLEVRMADALPLKLALGYLALMKGLLYDQDNLEYLNSRANTMTSLEVEEAIVRITGEGCQANYTDNLTMAEWLIKLIEVAPRGLDVEENSHLLNLANFIDKYLPPRQAVGDTGNLAQDLDYAVVK